MKVVSARAERFSMAPDKLGKQQDYLVRVHRPSFFNLMCIGRVPGRCKCELTFISNVVIAI